MCIKIEFMLICIYNIMSRTTLTYDSLSRDFELISVVHITLVSMKHRIVLTASYASGIKWCKKCDNWVDGYEDHSCQKRHEIKFIGNQFSLKIRTYDNTSTALWFVIEKIEDKFGMNMPIWTVYHVFNIIKIQWWNREDDYSKQICVDLASKIMIIRDFIPFDCWCYIVDIMIDGDKTRSILFSV
jgi:hypothetical protein